MSQPSRKFIAITLSLLTLGCTVPLPTQLTQICNSSNIQLKEETQSYFQDSQLFPVEINQKWGFINLDGDIVIQEKFKEVSQFSEGLAAFKSLDDGRWGYIDVKGNIVIEPKFEAAFPFANNLAIITVDGKQGVIDSAGSLVYQPIFDKIKGFSENRAFVLSGDKWKLINENGSYVNENYYSQVNGFRQGLASFVGFNGDYGISGYINLQGEVSIEMGENIFPNIEALGYTNGLASVYKLRVSSSMNPFASQSNNIKKYGLIDTSGNLKIPFKYDFSSVESNCIIRVSNNNRFGLLDLDGNIIISPTYVYIGKFSEGLALAKRNSEGKYGYIDKSGTLIIEAIQEINFPAVSNDLEIPESRNFYDGLAIFKETTGRYGYINTSGQIVIQPQFDRAYPFKHGLAKFNMEDKWGYINRNGLVVWQQQ
ncbi:WG repeat-containing protein [Leptothoe sp. LEGE 181152]|nr:WG repeat-containing protein [Leptothoe sp. LEGE 181152]